MAVMSYAAWVTAGLVVSDRSKIGCVDFCTFLLYSWSVSQLV